MPSRMIDILAALLILLAVVKLILLSINAPTCLAAAKTLYARHTVTATVSYLLPGVVLYVLLKSGLTIVQILAACLFVVLLLIPGLTPYMGEMLRELEGKAFRQILRVHWLSPLPQKPSQGLMDDQDEMMGRESVMNLVPCESTYSNYSTPGFAPHYRYNSILLNHSVGSRNRWIDRGIALSITLYLHSSHPP